MKDVTLKVTGMQCGGCATTVQRAPSGVQGVRRADVSLEHGRAELLAEDDVAVADLATAVKNAGCAAAESA